LTRRLTSPSLVLFVDSPRDVFVPNPSDLFFTCGNQRTAFSPPFFFFVFTARGNLPPSSFPLAELRKNSSLFAFSSPPVLTSSFSFLLQIPFFSFISLVYLRSGLWTGCDLFPLEVFFFFPFVPFPLLGPFFVRAPYNMFLVFLPSTQIIQVPRALPPYAFPPLPSTPFPLAVFPSLLSDSVFKDFLLQILRGSFEDVFFFLPLGSGVFSLLFFFHIGAFPSPSSCSNHFLISSNELRAGDPLFLVLLKLSRLLCPFVLYRRG